MDGAVEKVRRISPPRSLNLRWCSGATIWAPPPGGHGFEFSCVGPGNHTDRSIEERRDAKPEEPRFKVSCEKPVCTSSSLTPAQPRRTIAATGGPDATRNSQRGSQAGGRPVYPRSSVRIAPQRGSRSWRSKHGVGHDACRRRFRYTGGSSVACRCPLEGTRDVGVPATHQARRNGRCFPSLVGTPPGRGQLNADGVAPARETIHCLLGSRLEVRVLPVAPSLTPDG